MKKFIVYLILVNLVVSLLYGVSSGKESIHEVVMKDRGDIFGVIYSCVVSMFEVLDTARLVNKICSFKERNGKEDSFSLDGSGGKADNDCDKDKFVFMKLYQTIIFVQFIVSCCVALFIFVLSFVYRNNYIRYNFAYRYKDKYTYYRPRSSISDDIDMFL